MPRPITLADSGKKDWRTPVCFFAKLNGVWDFRSDLAASDENHLCGHWFTEETDACRLGWPPGPHWCNPPFGAPMRRFLRNFAERSEEVVALIPCRTSRHYFHDLVYIKASWVCYLRGRLRFSGSGNDAPFDCCLAGYNSQLSEDQHSTLESLGHLEVLR